MTQNDTGRRAAASGAGVTLALAVAATVGGGTPAQADDGYTVREGDTVSHIAARHGTTVAAVVRANHLVSPNRILPGQHLSVPGRTAAAARTATAAVVHRVVSGDTVSELAARYGTSVAAIVHRNDLDGRGLIRVGQRLTIPRAGTATAARTVHHAAARSTTTYTVRSGDTVSAIAARHGTTVAAVVARNGLDRRAFIRVGQVLTVPGAATTTRTSGHATGGRHLVGDTFAGRTYPAAVVASANANKAALLRVGVPSRESMRSRIVATAHRMGVPAALALAIGYQESGFDQSAVSPANAIGTMQVIPSSGEWASDLVGRRLNLLDPDDNVTAGVAILRQLRRGAPDLPTAIAGYYQGAASVRAHGMFADTRRYVANVQTLMARFN